MDVIGRPQSPLQLYYSCLSSPLNNRCIPLIDNLVSFPLIFKDVRLYNEVKSRMFHFVLSFFLNVKTSLGNGCSFAIQFMKGLMSSTAAEESECWSCSMSPHKSSGKQSHPVILLRVVLLSMKNNRIHLRSHTCSSCIFLSSHYIFLWFCSSCSFFSLSLFYFSLQVTRTLPVCSHAASVEGLVPPCAPAATTLWTAEGRVSPPSQQICLTAWLRCKHIV